MIEYNPSVKRLLEGCITVSCNFAVAQFRENRKEWRRMEKNGEE